MEDFHWNVKIELFKLFKVLTKLLHPSLQNNLTYLSELRDIDELEDQGVKVYARGKLGGYQIKDAHAKILSLTEQQLSALFLTLNESQSNSTLPYQNEIRAIIKQCLNLPQTRLRKLLKNGLLY